MRCPTEQPPAEADHRRKDHQISGHRPRGSICRLLRKGLPQGAAPEADARIAKELTAVDAEIAEIEAKLGKPSFVEKAPPAVVEKNRQRLRELKEKRAALGGATS